MNLRRLILTRAEVYGRDTRVLTAGVCAGLLSLVLLPSLALAQPHTPRQEMSQAAVAMPDRFAAQTARTILEAGGNAVDAAVASAFSLAVTYPEAGNIGGGGFMVSHVEGQAAFLDFRETAPLTAQRNMFLDANGEFQQRRSLVGGLAVGVPGTVRGLEAAHQRYGTLPWAQLLAPAIALAEQGFEVPASLAELREESVEYFAGEVNFAKHFSGLRAGARFRQPALARTLRRIADDPDDFYTGLIAQQIISQMAASNGLLRARDLAEYQPLWRDPLSVTWRDYVVLSTAPPSSGGIALAQQLTMRDALNSAFAGLEHNSADYLHLIAEIQKRVFADRGDYLGDPDFSDLPTAALIDADYLQRRAAGVNTTAISRDVQPGLSAVAQVREAAPESPDTTHFSILDGQGNAVSLTYTLNFEFGSGVVVEGAGFLLNNEMDDFSAKPGVPNGFGVIGADANAVAPGKRMLSSMSPAILLQDGRAAVVLGTPGGSTIFTSVFQVILNLVDFGMSAEAAVSASRFHHQLPAATELRHDPEASLSAADRRQLTDLGYDVVPNWWGPIGDIQLIRVSREDRLEAAADPRGRGRADVFAVPNRTPTAEAVDTAPAP